MKRVVARWESVSGKWYVELTADKWGYTYDAVGAGGSLGKLDSDKDAVKAVESRLNDFQPDRNTTDMRRVV